MAEIEFINSQSPHLDGVKSLWKKNRKTLGPYPNGAFDERAENEEIIVALDGEVVVGYALFYISQKHGRVRLTHLCVDTSHCGQGIARQLFEVLRCHTTSQKGIGLHCRRDYDACNLWPKLGLVPISEKVGRSKEGHELIYFWLPHPHPSLFSSTQDDERLKVVIDANVFLDFDDPDRNGADETAGMMADWLQPLVQICINEELYTEIYRDDNADQRRDRLSKASGFECLESNTDEFLLAQNSVRALLGTPNSEQDESDQRHLCRTIASDATVFVTRDDQVLKVADEIYDQHGLSIVRPSQLVAQFEELRNERDYQRARLAGSPLQFRRASDNATGLAECFQAQAHGERRHDLEELLNRTFANPDGHECHLVEASDGRPLAIHVAETANPNLLTISTFRIAKRVQNTRLAPTLARTLLSGIVQNALRSGISAVRVTETALSPVVIAALRLSGFFPSGGSWLKLSIVGVHDVSQMAERVAEIARASDIESAEIQHILDAISDPSFTSDTSAVLATEHILWPGKFCGCNVANFVVSIEPRWASDLFDAGLANASLWGAETELALNPDSVYYRSTRPPMRTEQGRILWYVSQDRKISGSKCIRACSQLGGVTIGGPKELFRRFKRLGVYQWQHVLGTAGSIDGELMALEFSDTELFRKTISWESAQSILQAHDIRSTFLSPTVITEDAFVELYRIGLGLNETTV
ncbi:MAG: GNAT family N-acetyltransferase [bacterium]|nr:GNAT family N-acetyltransferase [bacterium]